MFKRSPTSTGHWRVCRYASGWSVSSGFGSVCREGHGRAVSSRWPASTTRKASPIAAEAGGEEDEVQRKTWTYHQSQMMKTLTKIPHAIKLAVKRLHENTGHRSNRRLARALTISGAPREVIQAAKYHRCSVCAERKTPKARRPASLPTPKDVSDQIHVDIFEAFDSRDQGFYIIHVIDYSSRFQLAEVLPNKSSSSVVAFFKKRWFPIFGSPRVLVADPRTRIHFLGV